MSQTSRGIKYNVLGPRHLPHFHRQNYLARHPLPEPMSHIDLKLGRISAKHVILFSICIALFALIQVSVYWCVIALCFTLLIFLAYRQYETDVDSRAKEVASGNGRADISENYIEHLQQYIGTLEKSIAILKEKEVQKGQESSHNDLTGLPDRLAVLEILNSSLEKTSNKFAVLYLNLNRFRAVKEGLGHATGDRIIKQVAERIISSIRSNDIAGHLGGDEFVILLHDVVDPSEATNCAEKIGSRVAEAVRFRKRTVHVTASIGIVLSDGKYVRPEDILRDAEIAMYNAKDGKTKWTIFERKMFARTFERQQLEADLRYAIVCNELELFYQPIVRLNDRSLYGFEALVRWNHPRKGFLEPSEFIPAAEANGLIAPMSMQILRDACEQLSKWASEFEAASQLIMSVNISAANIADPNFLNQLESILLDTGVRRNSLKLEITEGAVMEDAERAIKLLKRIKQTGVSLSIDDFGTGYSSLSYLQKFPLDFLKIDRSFVSEMEGGEENEEIVRTILALAKALNLNVIAEGIETETQAEKLIALKCELGQGFLFSRPVPVREAEALIGATISLEYSQAPFDGAAAIELESTH